MRVLASVYVCAKEAGSEPEIGYTTIVAAARAGHQVTVLTWAPGATKIREDLANDGVVGAEVVGVEGLRCLDRYLGRMGVGHLHYIVWQVRAAKQARQMELAFDIAHHVTFGSDWMPSALHSLRCIPVVWGPVGGYAQPAWAMVPYLSTRGLIQEAAREGLTRAARMLTLRAVRRSRCLVVAHNSDTARWYRQHGAIVTTRPLVAMPGMARGDLSPVRPASVASIRDSRRRSLVFIGRLTPWKGCLLAVRTLAQLPPSWRLDLYGHGPLRDRIAALAKDLGVADRVCLKGQVPKAEIWQALANANALLLPSLHDSAPQPVAQALRSGCPVVCLDTAGPPELTGDRGVAVRLGLNLPRRLADAVQTVGRFPPDDRWSEGRLPSAVDELYRWAASL